MTVVFQEREAAWFLWLGLDPIGSDPIASLSMMTGLHFRWLPSSSPVHRHRPLIVVAIFLLLALLPIESLGASFEKCGHLPPSVEAEVQSKCLPLQPLAGVDIKIFHYPDMDSPNLKRCTSR